MTRLFIEGQSDSPVTIPTNPPITVNPVNNTYSQQLTSEQRDQFTIGQVITITSGGENQSVTIPDYTDTRSITILPVAGTVLTGSTMDVSALPLSQDWLYKVQVNDITSNIEIFTDTEFSSENNYRIEGLPTNGETLRIYFTIDKDDGQGPQVYDHDVIAFSSSAYKIFDIAFAQSTFEIRPFGENIDDISASPVTNLIQGVRYRIRAAFADTDGNYTGNLFPDNPIVPLTSNFGNPAFAKRQGTTVYNLYEFTPSSSGTVNFNFGVFNSSAQSTATEVTISRTVDPQTSTVQLLGPFQLDGSTHTFNFSDSAPATEINGIRRYDIWDGDRDLSTAVTAPATSVTAYNLPTDGQQHVITLRPPAGYFEGLFEPVTAVYTAATGELYPINLGTTARPIGGVTHSHISNWLPGLQASTNEHNLGIVVENGESMLRHEYVPNYQGSERVVLRWNLPHQRTYRIRETALFEEGYQWGRIIDDGRSFQSAKFGFGFGGGSLPSGSQVKPDGFTARLNVHGEHLGGNRFSGRATLVSYSYQADRELARGQIDPFPPFLPINQWFTVVIEVEMNTDIALSDGSMRVWVDGVLRHSRQNIQWWAAGDVTPRIDTLYYSSFFGGNQYYAPPYTVYARYKNIAVAPVINGNCAIQP